MGVPHWNATFLDFALRVGFETRLCRPYRAQTKGCVESGIKYVKHKAMLKSGMYREIKRRAFHEKPSEKRNRKKREALRKYRKARDASGELKVKVAAEARHFREE